MMRATNRAGILFLVIRREMGVKIVPVIKSGDLKRSVDFYTRVLDFERKWPLLYADSLKTGKREAIPG